MRKSNYCAFYVSEPFDESRLGANATKDFVYYNMLRAWKGNDSTFPFDNAHSTTYSVRDTSDWDLTLKPRIRERIRNSKSIILFLSSLTKNSRAIREEIDYGINSQGLPIIVIYPDFTEKNDIIDCQTNSIKASVKNLWANLPIFRDSMDLIPTMHIPYKKELIKTVLTDPDFMIDTKCAAGRYFYKC